MPKNTVLYRTRTVDATKERLDTTDEHRTYKITVLVNKTSASASEILAATLSEKYGAKIVGQQSFGKGTVQQVINTASGGFAKITTQEWLSPNGKQIDKLGITPDYEIELNMTEYNKEKLETDNQLQKALEIIVK